MPKYLAKMRLDLFDKAFTSAYCDDEKEDTVSFQAIEISGNVAFENMYVAFSLEDTLRTYNWAIDELENLGISIFKKLRYV